LNNHKNQKTRIRIVKWFVALLALSFLYYEIFVKHQALLLFKDYRQTVIEIWPSLLLVGLLMPLNWLIESLKWRRLLKSTTKISVYHSIKGVLMGVSLGLFTPNGVGEFAGRMWVVNKVYREQAVSSSIVGSLSQLCITITIGGALIVFFASQWIAETWLLTAQILATLTVLIGFYAYYKMPEIAGGVLSRIKVFSRFDKFRQSMMSFTKGALTSAYLSSLLRYAVFCSQLGILIVAVGDLTTGETLMVLGLIPVYYYIQTLVPTIALSEIGVRGLIMLFLFSSVLVESEVILISFLIWMINLIVPGVIGLIFLANNKFRNK